MVYSVLCITYTYTHTRAQRHIHILHSSYDTHTHTTRHTLSTECASCLLNVDPSAPQERVAFKRQSQGQGFLLNVVATAVELRVAYKRQCQGEAFLLKRTSDLDACARRRVQGDVGRRHPPGPLLPLRLHPILIPGIVISGRPICLLYFELPPFEVQLKYPPIQFLLLLGVTPLRLLQPVFPGMGHGCGIGAAVFLEPKGDGHRQKHTHNHTHTHTHTLFSDVLASELVFPVLQSDRQTYAGNHRHTHTFRYFLA